MLMLMLFQHETVDYATSVSQNYQGLRSDHLTLVECEIEERLDTFSSTEFICSGTVYLKIYERTAEL